MSLSGLFVGKRPEERLFVPPSMSRIDGHRSIGKPVGGLSYIDGVDETPYDYQGRDLLDFNQVLGFDRELIEVGIGRVDGALSPDLNVISALHAKSMVGW